MPDGDYPVCVRPSSIAGMGVFTTAFVSRGTVIAPARIGVMRTPAGRYTNHSLEPNAKMVMRDGGNIDLVAIRDIQADVEITTNYRDTARLGKAHANESL